MAEGAVSAQRPYLLRAMHEWMTDNAMTPHIVVDAAADGARVPSEHVKDGKIVLNVSYAATRGLVIGNDTVAFEARFNGVPRAVSVPVSAVLGIYARESGQGMVFSDEVPPAEGSDPEGSDPEGSGPEDSGPDGSPPTGGGRPQLKVVK